MQLESTKIIDQYLSGEMSASDHAVFEQRLKTSEKLQQEVTLQQNIQEAAIRASFRADVKHAARRYKLNRVIKFGAAGLGLLAVILSVSVWFSSSSSENNIEKQVPIIALSLMEKLNPSAEFAPLPIQYFSVPKEGDVFLSDQSVLLSIPDQAFLLNNKVYRGEAVVQFQEALKANEIVKAGLNTLSGDHLLETQGMFSIHAFTPSGEKLEINPNVGIYVQVPVNEYKDGMNLYDYVKLEDGTSDWQNSRGLTKIPVPVSMKDLDFYPVGYEAKLNDLKWKKTKSKRDSLYLSLEDYCLQQEAVKSNSGQSNTLIEESKTTLSNPSRMPINTVGQVVEFPELEARFPGGSTVMRNFIFKTCIYPEKALRKGVQGTVLVSFDVDEFGFISNEKVARSLDNNLDNEAIRIVQKMPRWIPAQEKNNSVRSRVLIPISFTLEDGSDRPRPKMEMVSAGSLTGFARQDPSPEVQEQDQDTTTTYSVAVAGSGADIEDTPCQFPHVAPSRVLAFWKPSFNNTNLATREFERRMKAIHGTCNNAVLQKYTSQISKPISEIDAEVTNMGYSEFTEFSREQVGVVDPNNPHLKNLQEFYKKGVASLREQAKNDKNWEQSLRSKWDAHLAETRTKHSSTTKKLAEQSQKDETVYNDQRTVQKLGLNNQARMNPVAVYPQFGRSIGFTARRSGGYNCDRAVGRIRMYQASLRAVRSPSAAQDVKIKRVNVSEAVKKGTAKRETFSVTENGNTRIIAYNSLTFEVANAEKYDRIIAYAFPHQLESYQLLIGKDGKFGTSLNDDIVYDICIVGISAYGYAYFQKQTLKGGQLGSIHLKTITEKQLDVNLLQLNAKRIGKPASFATDLDWIKTESKNYSEVNRRKKMTEFRATIVKQIYPCHESNLSEDPVVAAGDDNSFGI